MHVSDCSWHYATLVNMQRHWRPQIGYIAAAKLTKGSKFITYSWTLQGKRRKAVLESIGEDLCASYYCSPLSINSVSTYDRLKGLFTLIFHFIWLRWSLFTLLLLRLFRSLLRHLVGLLL